MENGGTPDAAKNGLEKSKSSTGKLTRSFPVFYPVRAATIADEWSWKPYNVWWLIIIFATYFTVFFVPYDIAFNRETTGANSHCELTQVSCEQCMEIVIFCSMYCYVVQRLHQGCTAKTHRTN